MTVVYSDTEAKQSVDNAVSFMDASDDQSISDSNFEEGYSSKEDGGLGVISPTDGIVAFGSICDGVQPHAYPAGVSSSNAPSGIPSSSFSCDCNFFSSISFKFFSLFSIMTRFNSSSFFFNSFARSFFSSNFVFF